MKKIVVLGAGQVGRAIAIDLCKDYQVVSADINSENLERLMEFPIQTVTTDIRLKEPFSQLISDADLVIGAVPGFMGFEMMKAVIACKKNIVDISFFNEDPFLLDSIAKDNNVTAVFDCGVAPGMDNMILGYHNKKMNVSYFECLVGGLPVVRSWPFEYKAPFSPIDVIAEYTRPARFVTDGNVVVKPALSDPELIEFPGVGTLEAFNTDGLRSLMKTMNVPDMIERTLRYPGHINYMKMLRNSGFFGEEEISINGTKVRPIDVTTKLLFPLWKLQEDEEEFTLMQVTVGGTSGNKEKRLKYYLHDRYNPETKTSSMARSTGFTCTAVARLVIENKFTRKGIIPPEFVGQEESCFAFVMNYLKERGVNYKVTEL